MSRLALWLSVALAVGIGSACSKNAAPRIVDLGHPLAATDPSWDGPPAFAWSAAATFDKEGYFAGKFSSEEHFGTHVDAPAHFDKGGLTVDQIPPDRLMRPAVRIDMRGEVEGQGRVDARLSLNGVREFERAHGTIPDGAVVLVQTGWSARWPDRARYMNETGGVKHFPGVSIEAAEYLAKTRKVAAIGIDTPSIDYGPSAGFETHHVTMAAGLYHLENLTNLDGVPEAEFTVVVAPLKIRGGSGAPARVFGLIPIK